MKFGLTGYVKGRFNKTGIVPAEQETAISFTGDANSRALSLPVEGHDYTFRLIVQSAPR